MREEKFFERNCWRSICLIVMILVKEWLALHFHDQAKEKIKKPDENENEMPEAPNSVDEEILDRIKGSMIGMALGDALGAHVEFRPRQYLVANPVKDLEGGGTWGLQKGQVEFSSFSFRSFIYLLKSFSNFLKILLNTIRIPFYWNY